LYINRYIYYISFNRKLSRVGNTDTLLDEIPDETDIGQENEYIFAPGEGQKPVGLNSAFFLFSRYAGEFLKVLKMKYPSSSLTISLTVDGLRTSLAVHVLPSDLQRLNTRLTLSVIFFICIFFSLKNIFKWLN
jgi:hypothetical protein